MPRYIDADKLKKHYSWWKSEDELPHQKEVFDQIIDLQPTADVQEVKHGKWIICGAFDDMIKCSECEKRSIARMRPITYRGLPKWCEDCGARMDGDEK